MNKGKLTPMKKLIDYITDHDYFFFFFWLHWVFVAARGLFSSCSEQGLLLEVCKPLTVVASPVAEHGLQARGLQQLWLAGSRAQAQQLWRTGLVAPWLVGSSRTRARTRVPCIGRRILNHCAIREVPTFFFLIVGIFSSK